MSNVIPALCEINIPPHVVVKTTNDLESLMAEIGRRSLGGYAGDTFFGTAFIQGSRLQFTTAMPIQKMVEVSKTDRSKKKDNVREVTEHSNRPQEPAHAKQLQSYLLKTACTGDKFILPAFTFNYGVALDDDAPSATLVLLSHGGEEGVSAWPGMLLLPNGAKLDTTDGAHRRAQIDDILRNPKVEEAAKLALKRNAVDVKIVFESSRSDSHQDFADCGKAKAIPKSLVATFDVRDRRNHLSRELVKNNPFLANYVDATASNVNLSAKSRMIWSMSAIRMFVAHVVEHHPDENLTEDQKLDGAGEFFSALVRRLPQLAALDKVRNEKNPSVTTGGLRELKGGDVSMRGMGMAIFARAFLHCKESGIGFDEMASRLAKVDWHLLSCDRSSLPQGEGYAIAVKENALPMWMHLLVIGESRYRVSSSSTDADVAWAKITEQYLSDLEAAA